MVLVVPSGMAHEKMVCSKMETGAAVI